MKIWEYKIVPFPGPNISEIEKMLNLEAEDGWELKELISGGWFLFRRERVKE